METNIINNLTTFVNKQYELGKANANMFANNDRWDAARAMAKSFSNQAYGAVEFAVMLCHENGYPDMAGEILEKWNGTWSEWFNKLENDYEE